MVTINLLGLQLNSNKNIRIQVDVDCNEKVARLKNDAAEKLNLPKSDLLLTYCGNILEDEENLSKYGIKHGVTVHILKKIANKTANEPRKMTEGDIQQLATAFKTFKLSTNYRSALQRLTRPEIIQNIIATTPALSKDLVALAVIQDPELLVQLTDIQILRKIVEVHPSLGEVANHIAASIHEEASKINPDVPGPSSGYSYSLEALSDDDMDSSSSDGPLSGQQPSITAAQVAAALASASAQASNLSSSSGIITSEMFNNAMQQVFGSVSTDSTNPASNEMRDEESIEAITRRLAPQINQMRELGLTDIVTNIQALQATGGDVQGAIDLVFNGVIPPSM